MVEEKTGFHPADTNGDGEVSATEKEMYLEFIQKLKKENYNKVPTN